MSRPAWQPDRVKAVVLDWAGTTVDFGSRAPVEAVQETFRRRGVEVTDAEARGPMGLPKREHLRRLLALPAVRERWSAAHGRPPDAGDLDGLWELFVPIQRETLRHHARLVPGTAEAVRALRERGLRIGSSTGYDREMLAELVPEAEAQGYAPDVVVCADDVEEGRPAPWMILENARRLRVHPLCAVVKVDDARPGIEAGRHAGVWTVAVAASGNEVGLAREALAELPASEREHRIGRARRALHEAGAHLVIETIADLPSAVTRLEARLAAGERP